MGAYYLAAAIAAEVLATVWLKQSDGFTEVGPSIGVLAGYGVAFYFLSLALRDIELGTAYAVWSGVGTAAVFLIGLAFFGESSSALKVASLVLIIAGVLGLNVSDA